MKIGDKVRIISKSYFQGNEGIISFACGKNWLVLIGNEEFFFYEDELEIMK